MKRLFACFIVVLLVLMSLPIHSIYASGQAIQQPTVTVKLVNYLGNVINLSIKFSGNYRLNNEGTVESGKTYQLRLENGRISMFDGTHRMHSLTELTFTPVQYNEQHLVRINNRPYLGTVRFVIEGAFIRPINTLPVEDYLKGVVPSEMPASWNVEALKAQAVAARTYVMSQGPKVIDDTINYQVYAGYAWHTNSTRAVNETSGQTLTHNGRLISAVYSSSNGGITESNGNVWGGTNLPYLPIKADPYDSIAPWNFTINKNQIDLTNRDLRNPQLWWSTARERDTTIPNNIKTWLYQNGYPNTEIKIVSIPTFKFSDQKTTGGRVRQGDITVNFLVRSLATNDFVRNTDGTIRLHTVELKNTTAQRMRAMIGINLVRSYLVDSVVENDTSIIVNGRGFGHAVGMSQWGAKGMADSGFRVNDILQFYYPGTTLTSFIQYAPANTEAVTPIQPVSQPVSPSQPSPAPDSQVTPEVKPIEISQARAEYDARHDQVVVRYTLNQDALVTITVRDANHRVIATLIRDVNRKAGDLAQFWTVGSHPNGTYSFTIEAKGAENQTVSAQVQQSVQKVVSQPVTSQPTIQQPAVQPVASQPTTQEPAIQPVASQPAIQQPTTQQPAPSPTPQSVQVARVGTQVTARVNVNAANIRRSATTSSAIVGTARLGQNVNILGRSGDFYQIQIGKTRGFIHVNLLTLNQTLAANDQTAVVINGRVANVQGNPVARNKTVYIPLKGAVENLKMSYSWNKSTNNITVRDPKTTLNMKVSSKQVKVNSRNIRLTNHPEVLHSRVYVSIRTLNETLSMRSHWDTRNRVVWISR
ncbi:SpoIID/LytB domain-containing protein [Alkalihalobacterium sp. APHAB7]|uniref:SpoIID/LytB domain-containing protein n=1 Tax=Alkalihalobacterium sp. APHAB7 TaxID=3402081 RepID=UPI003AAF4A47